MKELIRQSSKNENIYQLSSQIEESRSGSKLARRKTNPIIEGSLKITEKEKENGRELKEERMRFVSPKPTLE